MEFFGREDELAQLSALWNKRVSSLVTCRGRRRVGKSTLVERFAAVTGCRFVKIEGRRPKPGMSNADELAAFASQLADQSEAERTAPATWNDAFRRLSREIRDGEKTVVLLDEISWLAHYDDAFADELKIAWDNILKKHDRLVLVLCGSVSSWLRDNIVENGAYVGRRSLDIVVRELPLRDCVRFWGAAAARTSPREIFDVLSVTGGVPRYLEEIDPALPAAENIRRLAFLPNSVLRNDFDEMFSDVITRRPAFTGHVLRALVDGPKGAEELAAVLGVPRSGNITLALRQLEDAGLVAREAGRNPESGRPVKNRRYRIRDNYARFYLKFVEPVKEVIDDGSFAFVSMEQFDGWETVMGLQFETLIVNNYPELLPSLHLGRALIVSAAPFHRNAGAKSGRKGLQVDLLLQTRQSVCIVEIKRQRRIGKEVVAEVEEKCRRLSRPSGVSLKTALVYDGELAPSLEADAYFDALVPARRLLGL
jgi:hypothetical protein